MGWREPEPQDVGRVVFNRSFKRTDANLIRAREILRNSYLSRHGGEVGGAGPANVYFDQAMKTRPEAAWDALLKEILKGDSKKIWHGEHIENCHPQNALDGLLHHSRHTQGALGVPLECPRRSAESQLSRFLLTVSLEDLFEECIPCCFRSGFHRLIEVHIRLFSSAHFASVSG